MVVGNDTDRYWVVCNACKKGDVVMKEHVVITNRKAPAESSSLVLPHDMLKLVDCEPAVQAGVVGFLESKNMDIAYLPEVWFSKARCRIMIQHGIEWLGRDTTNASPQKWLTFNGSNHLRHTILGRKAVVVEDPFSYYKVKWALRDDNVAVFSSLGTKMSDELMLILLDYEEVSFFYDDDAAGHRGALKESQRLRALGVNSRPKCAIGGDPKDMTIEGIQHHARS